MHMTTIDCCTLFNCGMLGLKASAITLPWDILAHLRFYLFISISQMTQMDMQVLTASLST